MSQIYFDNETDGMPGIQHPGPFIVVLAGLPASGKSTFRSQFKNDGIHLSTDDIVDDIAKWEGTTYDQVWEREIKAATASVNTAFRAALKDGASIVWDQTNLTAKKRKGILSQVPAGYYKVCIFIQCHEDLRQKRLASRPGKVIPKHIDDSMRANVVVPTKEEGFDEVLILDMGPPHTGMKKRELLH